MQLKIFIILWVVLLASCPEGMAQSGSLMEERGPAAPELLEWNEEFVYEVRYSFFKLGQIRVTMTDTLYRGEPAWLLSGVITSAPGIPFVGREENHYQSIFRVEEGRPRELVYWKDDVDDENFDEDRYLFDYELGEVYAFREGEPVDTLDLEEPATSGPLIFFLSRLSAGEESESRVHIYLDAEQGIIDMEYTSSREERTYEEVFDEPVSAYYAEGTADFNGPFGFNGEFKAWFANDELRIPLEAHLNVWLGNVRVRLIEYRKELR